MFNELVDYISVGVKERDYVVDVAFPNQWFVSTLINDMRFEFRHEDVYKSCCLIGDHGLSLRLQVPLFVELE